MIFERILICALYTPYSIYFRMAMYICMYTYIYYVYMVYVLRTDWGSIPPAHVLNHRLFVFFRKGPCVYRTLGSVCALTKVPGPCGA